MDVSHLLSPPDCKPSDNFNSNMRASPYSPSMRYSSSPSKPFKPSPITAEYKLAPIASPQNKETMGRLPSPPVTPGAFAARNVHRQSSFQDRLAAVEEVHDDRDPLLFPNTGIASTVAPEQPLFPPIQQQPHNVAPRSPPAMDKVVTDHMAMHMNQFPRDKLKPTRDEYLLALSCVPVVSKKYAQNPKAWLQQERHILETRFQNVRGFGGKRYPTANPNLAKLAPAPAGIAKKRTTGARAPRAPRASRALKRTPQSKALDSFDASPTGSPAMKRAIGTSREDTDFAALPDYSPSTSTLPQNNPKSLKADWKGQMLDLSNDPHRDLLHEAELNLASTLRLSCATYLCSKRRIFIGRVNALHLGKEFRKTDSQQACKIDVNKASKLWTAYDKVGWFKTAHFLNF